MKKITMRPNGTKRVQIMNEEPSKTQQQFKDECDINNIVRKYKATGQLTHLSSKQGVYADVSEITDLQESLQKVQQASDAFNTLPAELRRRFGNNPQQLLEFLQDPRNFEEGVKLGIYEAKKPEPGEPETNAINANKTGEPKTGKKPKAEPAPTASTEE